MITPGCEAPAKPGSHSSISSKFILHFLQKQMEGLEHLHIWYINWTVSAQVRLSQGTEAYKFSKCNFDVPFHSLVVQDTGQGWPDGFLQAYSIGQELFEGHRQVFLGAGLEEEVRQTWPALLPLLLCSLSSCRQPQVIGLPWRKLILKISTSLKSVLHLERMWLLAML